MSDHVCFAGPLPPPTHGMSAVNAAMVAELARLGRVTAINSGPKSLARGGIGYHATRFARVMRGLWMMVSARTADARVLYASVDDGLGGVWTLTFIAAARLLGLRVFLHHHSFRYIDRPTPLMRTIVRAAGRHAEHILLCPTMKRRFGTAYPRAGYMVIVGNTVPVPPVLQTDAPDRRQTIGMLANLTLEKGLSEFIALLDADGSLQGILAGPIPDADDAQLVETARQRLGDRLDWRGPVHGADKEAFFADIDVFVFPTRYRTEAYPLVLVEALVRGVPVIAPDRGCIGVLAGLNAAAIVPLDQDFVAAARAMLQAGIERDRATVRREGVALNEANAAARVLLLDRLTGSNRATAAE